MNIKIASVSLSSEYLLEYYFQNDGNATKETAISRAIGDPRNFAVLSDPISVRERTSPEWGRRVIGVAGTIGSSTHQKGRSKS
jgi:hypothetical protein